MPLRKDSSDATRRKNVSEMLRSGHSLKQSLAAAYRIQREAKRKKKRG
jgi:hypothetical protein